MMSLWFEEYKKKYSGSLWGVLGFDTDKSHSTLIDNQSNPPFDRLYCIAINSRSYLSCVKGIITTTRNGSSLEYHYIFIPILRICGLMDQFKYLR